MYKYLLKRDIKLISKYYLVILAILNISILAYFVSYYFGLLPIITLTTNVTIGTILLTQAFFVDVATLIMINKDLKQSNYYLTKIKDYGIYINYKFFLNFLMLLIVLTISYLHFILWDKISSWQAVELFQLSLFFFIVWSLKLTLFTTVINNYLLLRRISSKSLSIIYLMGGMLYWLIAIIFWISNSLLMFSIRIIFGVFVINYLCGMIINNSRKIR